MKLCVGDPGSYDVDIYLNDEKCDLCIEADEENGIAKIYFREFQEVVQRYPNAIFERLNDPTEHAIAVIKGKVEIRKRGEV